jgi:hypothetical protein
MRTINEQALNKIATRLQEYSEETKSTTFSDGTHEDVHRINFSLKNNDGAIETRNAFIIIAIVMAITTLGITAMTQPKTLPTNIKIENVH